MAGGLLEGEAIQKERIEETVTRLEGIQWIGKNTNAVSTNVYFKVAALRCSSLPKLMVNKRMSHIKQTFVWWYGFTAVQIKILYQHIYWEWRFKSVFELKKLSAIRQCGGPAGPAGVSDTVYLCLLFGPHSTLLMCVMKISIFFCTISLRLW